MAKNVTHFEYADRGAPSVYKFRVAKDPTIYVWFEYEDGSGSLYTTPEGGPYRVEHPLESAEFNDLDALLAARGTTRGQWSKDLLGQFGERLHWAYP